MISPIYDKDNLPEKVKKMYEAFEELMNEGADINELKVSDITKKAGIGKGTAYEYFESKEEMFVGAQAYFFGLKFERMKEAAVSAESFDQAIMTILKACDGFMEKRAGLEVFLKNAHENFSQGIEHHINPECPPPDQADMVMFFGKLAKRGIDEGALKNADMELCIHTIVGSLVTYVISCNFHEKLAGDKDLKEFRDRRKVFCLESIKKLLA